MISTQYVVQKYYGAFCGHWVLLQGRGAAQAQGRVLGGSSSKIRDKYKSEGVGLESCTFGS